MMLNTSYIIATRNRLPFLQITLEKLMSELQQDEEIVVVDGNSTDGAKEYLLQLFAQGKIHQFISEPDRNQAHGWNKALLMANGIIIKKIIDDDVHSLPAIRKCRDFMLKNPQVDVCISNGLTSVLGSTPRIDIASRLMYYEAWKNGKTSCFTFNDVYMLVRKSSLSFLGLFDTQFAMMDWEYSLRCSYLQANIAYYTGYNSMSVGTPRNITSATDSARLEREGQIGKTKYGYKGDRSDISLYSELKIAVGKAVNYKSKKNSNPVTILPILSSEELSIIYDGLYKCLEDYNNANDFVFHF